MCIKEINDIQIHMNTGNRICNTDYPHLEVTYGNQSAKISLDLKLIQGVLPVDVTMSVLEWTSKHEQELLDKWYLMKNNIPQN